MRMLVFLLVFEMQITQQPLRPDFGGFNISDAPASMKRR